MFKKLKKLKKLKIMGSILVILVLALAGCGGGATVSNDQGSAQEGEPQKLVVVDWGGAITEARKKSVFEPFEKEYNVEIVSESPTDYGKFKAIVGSGNVVWDVVNVENDFALRGAKEDLLEPLDFSVINKEGFEPGMITDYSIGAEYFTTTIAFNSKTELKPKTWAEFWDTEKFPGSRSLYKSVVPALEIALLADGVAPADLYPLDVERAFKSLDKIKKDVKVWWTTGAQPPQILADGSITYSSTWNGRISEAQKQGTPVEQDFTQGVLAGESWVIPKGSKNKDLAMKFIAYASKPEVQAEFAKTVDYIPANTKSIDLLPEDVKERLGLTSESPNSILVNDKYWLENYDELNARFQEWLLQ